LAVFTKGKLLTPIAARVAIIATFNLAFGVACNSKIASERLMPKAKLEASSVTFSPGEGGEVSKEGISVSVPAGAFSEPVVMDVEPIAGGIEIETTTKAGVQILAGDVLKNLQFCTVISSDYDQSRIYIIVKISENANQRQEIIPNVSIEFSDVNDKPQACWSSKYVNAIFQVAVGELSSVAAKLTDPTCIDPDLSGVKQGIALMLCDGTIAFRSKTG
jgi:hypothetical protein